MTDRTLKELRRLLRFNVQTHHDAETGLHVAVGEIWLGGLRFASQMDTALPPDPQIARQALARRALATLRDIAAVVDQPDVRRLLETS